MSFARLPVRLSTDERGVNSDLRRESVKPFILVASAGALVLTACANDPKEQALRSNPSFQDGYEDGCAAATNEGSDFRDRPTGDPERLQTDDAYRSGWSSGIAVCKRTNSQPGALPGETPPLVPGPSAH
jgi:hypothetical protein